MKPVSLHRIHVCIRRSYNGNTSPSLSSSPLWLRPTPTHHPRPGSSWKAHRWADSRPEGERLSPVQAFAFPVLSDFKVLSHIRRSQNHRTLQKEEERNHPPRRISGEGLGSKWKSRVSHSILSACSPIRHHPLCKVDQPRTRCPTGSEVETCR